MNVGAQRGCRGFTLVELAGVMVVLAALSFTAIPALSSIGRAGAAADRVAVETLTVLARERAWTTGLPHMLRIDPNGVSAEVFVLTAFDIDPVAIPGPTGGAGSPRLLVEDTVSAVVGAQAAADGFFEVWFSAAGEPLQDRPQDAIGLPAVATIEIRFSSGAVLDVLSRSGVLEW